MRDSQRSKVYRAENEAFKGTDEQMSVADVEAFVAEVWGSGTARAISRRAIFKPAPRVADGRGCRRASAGGGVITIPRWARSRWVVLHELAHELTWGTNPWHGPLFCQTYLALVERFLGFDARQRLGSALLAAGARTRP